MSVDKSERHAGDPGGEAHQDYPNKYAARGRSLGEPHNSSRTAVALLKRWPSTSERGTMTGATGSSSLFSSASASNSSYELARQTTSPGVRSPSRSSQIDRFDSTAKSFLSSTSRALKRHASKLSLASSISLDKDEEGKVIWKLSGLGAAEQESIDSSARSKLWGLIIYILSLTLYRRDSQENDIGALWLQTHHPHLSRASSRS